MLRALLFLSAFILAMSQEVRVEVQSAAAANAKVTTAHSYDAMVTLSIENADGTLTPSGWSTRKEHKGDGRPFSFTPGQNLIAGWTEGVLKMREGERALSAFTEPRCKGDGAPTPFCSHTPTPLSPPAAQSTCPAPRATAPRRRGARAGAGTSLAARTSFSTSRSSARAARAARRASSKSC
jgi:hypothetical protein